MEETMKDFERELNASFRVLKEGELLDGMIVDIDDDGVTLDIGYYTPGVVPLDSISDDPDFSALRDLKIGTSVKAIVVDTDDGKGNVLLSMKEARENEAWEKLQDIFKSQEIVSVHIKDSVPSGVITYLEGIRGFIPSSQLSLEYVENTSEYVGKTLNVRIITVDEKAKKLVLSAKTVLKEAADRDKAGRVSAITPGTVLKGTVDKIQPYGAFIQLENGLSGLVHISEICEKRIKNPSEMLKLGQEVKVRVLKVENGKISLSMKETDAAATSIKEEDISDDGEAEATCYSEEMVNTPFAALLAKIKL
ncbi:MAG: S1 RNA-binding domain-containing protein [Lachnospiraceae bacterium]|nr:S1 RNA-binding domain-containing protein [Lachnospiraceae bacterium]